MEAQHPFLSEAELKYKKFEDSGYMNKVPLLVDTCCHREITINEDIPFIILKKDWNDLMIKSTVFCEKPYSRREYGFNMRVVDQKEKVLMGWYIKFNIHINFNEL